MEAVRVRAEELDAAAALEHPQDPPQPSSKAMARQLRRSGAPAPAFARRLVWFHHIKSPVKRKYAVAWARELGLGGFCKPGYPAGAYTRPLLGST